MNDILIKNSIDKLIKQSAYLEHNSEDDLKFI